MNFKLWLEFEEVDPGNWDTDNEACNIHLDFPDGRQYGINVWTYKCLDTLIKLDVASGENLNRNYQVSPELFVKELIRNCIERTITDLLTKGNLENILNPSVINNEK